MCTLKLFPTCKFIMIQFFITETDAVSTKQGYVMKSIVWNKILLHCCFICFRGRTCIINEIEYFEKRKDGVRFKVIQCPEELDSMPPLSEFLHVLGQVTFNRWLLIMFLIF